MFDYSEIEFIGISHDAQCGMYQAAQVVGTSVEEVGSQEFTMVDMM